MANLPAAWWERGPPGLVACRDATASAACREETSVSTSCATSTDPATGEPVRRCVKIYRRYLDCAGQPVKEVEERKEVVERGEQAQQAAGASGRHGGAGGAGAPGAGAATGPGPAASAPMEDVSHAFEEFLRFAEELQEEMVPGVLHLDDPPAAAPRPCGDAHAQQQAGTPSDGDGAASEQQQQQQQQHFGWLGGLLFGKRRGGEGGAGAGRRPVNPSAWKEFEKEFTEV